MAETPAKRLDFCRNLRTKRYYASDEPPATYLTEEAATTGYWCLRTMGTFGPDDQYVCPGDCAVQRTCYETTVARPA